MRNSAWAFVLSNMLDVKAPTVRTKLDWYLRLVAALGWNGRIELYVNDGACRWVQADPDLPPRHKLPAVDQRQPLSLQQEQAIYDVELCLRQVQRSDTTYLHIPITDGVPGELRERRRDDITRRI